MRDDRDAQGKIGATMALAIRTRYWGEEEMTYAEMADEFMVSTQTITSIVKRKTYKDGPLVPGEEGYEEGIAERDKRVQRRRDAAAAAMEPGSPSLAGSR